MYCNWNAWKVSMEVYHNYSKLRFSTHEPKIWYWINHPSKYDDNYDDDNDDNNDYNDDDDDVVNFINITLYVVCTHSVQLKTGMALNSGNALYIHSFCEMQHCDWLNIKLEGNSLNVFGWTAWQHNAVQWATTELSTRYAIKWYLNYLLWWIEVDLRVDWMSVSSFIKKLSI